MILLESKAITPTKEEQMTRQTIPTAELRALAHKARTQHAFEEYVLDAYGYYVVARHEGEGDNGCDECLVVSDFENTRRGTIVWRADGCHR